MTTKSPVSIKSGQTPIFSKQSSRTQLDLFGGTAIKVLIEPEFTDLKRKYKRLVQRHKGLRRVNQTLQRKVVALTAENEVLLRRTEQDGGVGDNETASAAEIWLLERQYLGLDTDEDLNYRIVTDESQDD